MTASQTFEMEMSRFIRAPRDKVFDAFVDPAVLATWHCPRLNDRLDPEGSAGTITLFGDARSTYTRTARMALAEKGVAYRHESVGPHSPQLLAVNPFGRMPALLDGPIALYETSAIVR